MAQAGSILHGIAHRAWLGRSVIVGAARAYETYVTSRNMSGGCLLPWKRRMDGREVEKQHHKRDLTRQARQGRSRLAAPEGQHAIQSPLPQYRTADIG